MDSGNSGSIQSSSGGDDDYESRAADSSFSNPSSTNTTTTTNNPLLFSQSSTMFDPLSNYFDPPIPTLTRPQTHSSILNLDMPSWSKSQTNPFFTTQTPMSFPQISEAIATTVTAGNNNNNTQVMQQQDQTSQTQVAARNPKKRSRASRRAPTTVLTTDTSNFRAMVQEFTGIPAPPFTSSPFPRTRLDLFTSPTPSSFRSQPSNFNQNHHLLRPFPQKFQPQVSPFSTTNNNNINSVITSAPTTTPPSDQLGLLKPPQGSSSSNNYLLNNMQMQNLTFQSFLQPSSSNDQFGLTSHHAQLNANNPSPHLSKVVSSPRNHQEDGNGYNFSGSASSNLNFSGGKAVADNVSASGSTTRGEGLMDSWICSSD